ncbi:MAG TPA: DUF167 domain-containing protein [Candidatus Limnocylindria bacterium]|jgi:uncharacterized protein YggU (UPF0235/DUF167 family)
MPELKVAERDGRGHFAVRLIPRASRNAVVGVRDGVLHVRVTAAPVNGAANRALLELLGKTWRLGPTTIRIESGATSSRKRLSVPYEALARLRGL